MHSAEENHTKKLDKRRQRVRKYCSDTRLSVILKLIKPSCVCIFVLLHSQVRLFVGYWNFCSHCQALTTMSKGMKPLQNIVAHFVVQACTTFLHYTIASNFCLIILPRLLPKENFREPFRLPKLKAGSPSHIFRSPKLILEYQPGINPHPPSPTPRAPPPPQ